MQVDEMDQKELLDYLSGLRPPNDGSLPRDLKSPEGQIAARQLVRKCVLFSAQLIEAFSQAIALDKIALLGVRDNHVNAMIELATMLDLFEEADCPATKRIYDRLEELCREMVRILSSLRERMQLTKKEKTAFDNGLSEIRRFLSKIPSALSYRNRRHANNQRLASFNQSKDSK